MKVDNRKDWMLLLLFASVNGVPAAPIRGRTRLVKTLFLFKHEALKLFKKNVHVDSTNFYEFFPWRYGPFSKQVYEDVEFFRLRGFISAAPIEEPPEPEEVEEWSMWVGEMSPSSHEDDVQEYFEEEFKLTEKGKRFASQLYQSLTDEQRQLLEQFKTVTLSKPLRALLRYVYEKYPDQITRSEIVGSVLR